MMPAALLNGNVVVETAFYDGDLLVCKSKLRVCGDEPRWVRTQTRAQSRVRDGGRLISLDLSLGRRDGHSAPERTGEGGGGDGNACCKSADQAKAIFN
eukprot:scaffold217928_cov33-Tisochrysis_lutea.AAC.1